MIRPLIRSLISPLIVPLLGGGTSPAVSAPTVTASAASTGLATTVTYTVSQGFASGLIDFGDGTTVTLFAEPAGTYTADNTYASPGVYTITVTATNAAGSGTATAVFNSPYALATSSGNCATAADTGLPTGSGPVSVSCWVYSTSASYGSAWQIGSISGGALIYIFVGAGSAVDFANGSLSVTGGPITALDTWYHVVATLNTDGTADLYVDGSLAASGSLAGTNIVLSSAFSIGQWYNAQFPFTGRVASLRIYDRVLTSGEVSDLYALGIDGDYYSALTGSLLTGLLRAYDLNTLADQASGYTLTEVGSPTFVDRDVTPPAVSLAVTGTSGLTATVAITDTGGAYTSLDWSASDGSPSVSGSGPYVLTWSAAGVYMVRVTASNAGGSGSAATAAAVETERIYYGGTADPSLSSWSASFAGSGSLIQSADEVYATTTSGLGSLTLPGLAAIDGRMTLPSSLAYLSCNSTGITALGTLPSSLTLLSCNSTGITALGTLPSSLVNLACSSTGITALGTLPSSLATLACSSTGITALGTLPSSLTLLDCSSTGITALGTLPSSLSYLDCRSTGITDLGTLPSSLTFLDCNSTGITDLGTLPSSLATLACNSTGINQAGVDSILTQLAAFTVSNGYCDVRVSGGVAPSSTGVTAAATLTSRGWTVYHN